MDLDLSEFKDLFAAEAQEHLDAMNAGLLVLERNPQDQAALANVFRAAHTLKGIAATMGYHDLARLAHALEDRLDVLRQGEGRLTAPLADMLFQGVDALRTLVDDALADRPPSVDVDGWVARLAGEALTPEETPTEATPTTPEPSPEPVESRQSAPPPAPDWHNTVRVSTRHLDKLLNAVAELITSRSHLWRIQELYNLPDLREALERHDRLLANLRDAVLETRMVPIAHTFNRFPRMVRDLLREHGKEADFIIEGHDIELDRTILERIGDPLMHLLRNAVDHGIEPPEERERAGKPRRGIIRLRAWRDRESVIIEVSDDGRGLDKQRILEKAIERGLISPKEAADLPEHQVYMLICAPGFSTATEVTDVSGRGVGMDVVRREVEALHGSLSIESTPGQGTTFRLRLPLTLAIIQALLIRVGGEMYALPISQVERTLEVRPEHITQVQRWSLITDAQGKALPLVPLGQVLAVPGHHPTATGYAIVVGEKRNRVGLLVDELLGQEEIVIRPLPSILGPVPGIAGASILGEGQVILILDVITLLQSLPRPQPLDTSPKA